MTFSIFGSEFALGVLDRRPAVEQDTPSNTAIDFVRLFGLDRLSTDQRLVCRWHRGPDGRLISHWEPDIVLIPQR